MKSCKSIVLAVFLLGLIFSRGILVAQEKTDSVTGLAPILSLVYWSNSNDTVILTASIYVRREKGNYNLENAGLSFSMSDGKEVRKIRELKAGSDGNAIVKIPVKSGLLMDKEGKTTYTVDFAGKGKYLPAAATVTAKLALLQLTFTKEDSLNTIHVKATQVQANGAMIPLPKETVSIYVARMLSDLKIGEITLDDKGTGSLEYAGGLVGDSLGNLAVSAKIEENENFANVIGKSTVSWGIPRQYYLAEKPTRELWTPIAPIWMIITLIIMLAGVWGHYIFAVVQLVVIKRKSKQKKEYL